MNEPTALFDQAERVADRLRLSGHQLVLAESCTAGLVAAALGGVPGISRHLCGSAVVYQERTKAAWLDVPESLLAERGAVSAEVAAAMAAGALDRTPHADVAAAVTGHLGPEAPTDLDGRVFVAVQFRGGAPRISGHRVEPPGAGDPRLLRRDRQFAAAGIVLAALLAALS